MIVPDGIWFEYGQQHDHPVWKCLKFLQVFVGYQANFTWFYKSLKETNGDYIRYLLEKLQRENKVTATVKKWKC